jgi:ATP/maltotriose-dependent transcriptional regulator MalT
MSMSAGHLIDILDLDGAAQRAAETREIGRQLEFPTPRVSSTLDLAFIACRRGDGAEAERLTDSVTKEVTNGTGFHGWLWRSRTEVLRAEIADLAGRPEEALLLAGRAVETNTRLRRHKYVVAAEIVRARARWKLGQRDEATAGLSSVVAANAACPDPSVRLRLALALHALGGPPDGALAAAAVMETGLPLEERPAFHQAVDGSLALRL